MGKLIKNRCFSPCRHSRRPLCWASRGCGQSGSPQTPLRTHLIHRAQSSIQRENNLQKLEDALIKHMLTAADPAVIGEMGDRNGWHGWQGWHDWQGRHGWQGSGGMGDRADFYPKIIIWTPVTLDRCLERAKMVLNNDYTCNGVWYDSLNHFQVWFSPWKQPAMYAGFLPQK